MSLCRLLWTLTLLLSLLGCGNTNNALLDFDGDSWEDTADCAPADANIHPDQDDLVGDSIDNNCDGIDGLDFDDDGYASALSGGNDCNDADPAIHPGALDPLSDATDSDCDSHAGTDSDGDGFASLLSGGPDCDDSDPAINPLAEDLPNDGLDNDCDGVFQSDTDLDGFLADEDCDDEDAAVYPGAVEVLDAIDNDCDELVDEDTAAFDDDGDGSCEGIDLDEDGSLDCQDGTTPGDCDDSDAELSLLDQDGDGFSSCAGDCNDLGGTIFPGSVEFCDGVDNDCDGEVPAVESDQDGDGLWGCMGDCNDDPMDPQAASTHPLDSDGDGYSTCNTPPDCNDGDEQIHPAALDPTDTQNIDANCDGIDGVDRDGDGVASTASGGLDCNDDPVSPLASSIWPGAPDLVSGGIDFNCDGIPGVDEDGDGYASLASGGSDCDDTHALSWPGAAELCDSLDNDCDCPGDTNGDGLSCAPGDDGVDEGTQEDEDGDGELSCQGDCDNQDPTVYSTAPEICDGLDNDCDLVLPSDEADLDQDGSRLCDNDCDDNNPMLSSLAAEICDGIDNDCNCSADTNGDGTVCGAGDIGVDDSCYSCDETVFISGATSIQGAIDNAQQADFICIGPGTWHETLSITQSVSLIGTAGRTLTIIDAQGADSVVQLSTGIQPVSTLRGLTLTGGDGTANVPSNQSRAGGLHLNGATNLESLIIEGNSSRWNGGISMGSAKQYNLHDVVVRQNTAVHGRGGISTDGITGTWENVLIADNESGGTTAGMGLSLSSIHGTDIELRGNRSLVNAGAGSIYGGSSTFSTLRVIGNEAAGEAGGLQISSNSTLQISDGLFQGNSSLGGSSAGGGAIRIYDSNQGTGTEQIDISDSQFIGNRAFNGAGILQEGGDLTLSDSAFVGNESTSPNTGGGAGLYLTGATASLMRVEVRENLGTGTNFNGGGLYASNQTLDVQQSRFIGNQSRHGGAIHLTGSGTYSLSHIELSGNSAVDGGGLFAAGQTSIDFHHGRIVGNTAVNNGGGMFLTVSAPTQLEHLSVVGNEATVGGAMQIASSTASVNVLSLTNSNFSANSASSDGPGLYNDQSNYDPIMSACNAAENVFPSSGVVSNYDGFLADPLVLGNLSEASLFLAGPNTGLSGPADWDLHLGLSSALIDAGTGTDNDASPADIGMFGGNAQWDLDGDGYIQWWQPGPYDASSGLDCDDSDENVYPGSGC
jgi:hypothetical protein